MSDEETGRSRRTRWGSWTIMGGGAVAFLAGAAASVGSPQLILVNTGLVVTYPWRQPAAALLAAAGATLLASVLRRPWLRVAAGLLAAFGLFASLHLVFYRVEAGTEGLAVHGLLSRHRLGWRDIARIEPGAGVLLIHSSTSGAVRVDTTDFDPEDLARLERTIARRIRESSVQ